MNADQIIRTVSTLRELPGERECVEFKVDNYKPYEIGEYISALANSAALLKEPTGFIVWGIDDTTHAVLGTTFKPRQEKIGNQELESWLTVHLTPRINLSIHEVQIEGKPVVVFEVPAARHSPVRFKDFEYIRIGTYKNKLKEYPEKESSLWELLREYRFEHDIAMSDVDASEVLRHIDYPSYFDLMAQPLPPDRDAILNRLEDEKFIIKRLHGGYDITNFGGILFAKDLSRFGRLARKALRVIVYRGVNRVETKREYQGIKGYAVGFVGAIRYINNQLPMNEQFGQALRQEVRMYPEIAIRELTANALIHQDFSIAGAGPVVEIFDDRIEITNPGRPLIAPDRFIDQPPRSRNEDLAAFMRRINICEERGSGIDKVIQHVELFQLPPPDFRLSGENVISVLFAGKPLAQLSQDERIRACYQHTVLRYVSNERMTNSTLRSRFNIDEKNYSMASRIIRDTIDAGFIKPFNIDGGSIKQRSYVPIWA